MSGGQTPVGGDNVNGNTGEGPDKVAQALLQRAARATEEDGAVLYSESCLVLIFPGGFLGVISPRVASVGLDSTVAQLERFAIPTDSLYPALLVPYPYTYRY
jgi:hypothetical protein